MIANLINRFLAGIVGLIMLGLVAWVVVIIVREGAVLFALLFIIAAFTTGYVMEKVAGRL